MAAARCAPCGACCLAAAQRRSRCWLLLRLVRRYLPIGVALLRAVVLAHRVEERVHEDFLAVVLVLTLLILLTGAVLDEFLGEVDARGQVDGV